MKRVILAVALAFSFAAMPASACQRECDAPNGERGKYSHGFRHPNGQRCVCLAKYGTGESRTGPPAYYDCDWR